MANRGRTKTVLLIGVLASAVCAISGVTSPVTAGDDVAGTPTANKRPNGYHSLNAVDFSSATDGWAVGDWAGFGSGETKALVRHWDGEHWTPMPAPSPGDYSNTLNSVVALSANDAWAVGDYWDVSPHVSRPLFEHWDGSSWQRMRAPLRKGHYSGVSGTSSDDVWAVGWTPYRETGLRISHWDGVRWTNVAPPPDKHGLLLDVAADSRDDAWAVGNSYDAAALVVHWDGSSWSTIDSAATQDVQLFGVSVVSPDDVWAVGRTLEAIPEQLAVGHWDGQTWSWVDAPNPRFVGGRLDDVTAVSTNDVWAVGQQVRPNFASKTLVEHWDGERWSIVHSPNRARTDAPNQENALTGVAAISSDDVWSVGWFWPHQAKKTKTIIQHWDGESWTNFLRNK